MLAAEELEINEKAKLAREKARKDKDKSVNSQITTEQGMRKQREDFKESEKVLIVVSTFLNRFSEK